MFDRFFKKVEDEHITLEKIELVNENQIDELLDLSGKKTVLLFKHSTRCGISNVVLNRFEKKLNEKKDAYYYYFLDLLQYRNLSNLIAKKFNIPHQSPQLFVIKNGLIVNNKSHYEIMDVDV